MPSLLVKLRRLNIIKSSLIARTEDRAIAIHDVDKGSLDRGTPSPNHSDQVIDGAHKANSTTSIHPVTDASGTSAYTQTKGGRLLVNDGTTNRVVVGALTGGSFGMKVSKPTFDVTTTGDANLIFNSSQNVFKIVGTYSAPFALTSGGSVPASTSVTITHNLGYIPLTLSYANITTNGVVSANTGIFPLPYYQLGLGGGTTNVFITLGYIHARKSTTTGITFEIGVQAPNITLAGTITAYILQETAN